MTENVFTALAKAQIDMPLTVKKGSENPHFKSRYADLADVVSAVRPHLSKHGLTLVHTIIEAFGGPAMRTSVVHGASNTQIDCDVPLIVQKNDMQGFKSATTYAKRIGVESVTGLAPGDDDDGNAAAAAPPKPATSAHMKRQLAELDNDLLDANTDGQINQLAKEWKRKMDAERWPDDEWTLDGIQNDASYRLIVANKFKQRRQEIAHIEQPEAAE